MKTAAEASAHSGDQLGVPARVRAQLDELALIGADPNGGVTRLAYSSQERSAHQLFAEWVAGDGKPVEIDPAGNSVAIYREGAPYFLLGSHLDTVVQGGIYDGAAGVVGALEAARMLSDLDFGLRVVAFAGEEGARFGRPTLGSSIAAGMLSPEAFARLRDADDKPLAEAAAEVGLDPLACEPWIDERIACFFEIHIEQGRQLEAGAARIGLVDTIAGSVRIRFDFTGRADHSGATPMSMRLDALTAASEVVLAVEEAAQSYRSTVATVGKVDVLPNSVTTVPGSVRLWVDIRDVDSVVQRSTANAVFERALEIAQARGISVHGDVVSELTPVVLEAWPRALAHEECESLGIPYRVMPSGAGHDAAIVARQAPATMMFIPCVDGVSHSPREMASPDDIAVAASVVAATVRRAGRLLR